MLALIAWVGLNFIPRPAEPTKITPKHPTVTHVPSSTVTVHPPTRTPTKTIEPSRTPSKTFTPTLTFTPTPAREVITVDRGYEISRSGGIPGTQRSTPLDYTITVSTLGVLQIEIETGYSACSDIFFHILVDDSKVYTTFQLGPINETYSTGLIDLGPVKPGKHKLTLSPEGVPNNDDGSCNYGSLDSWGGYLVVYTSEYYSGATPTP
jgi:hypothetical protein